MLFQFYLRIANTLSPVSHESPRHQRCLVIHRQLLPSVGEALAASFLRSSFLRASLLCESGSCHDYLICNDMSLPRKKIELLDLCHLRMHEELGLDDGGVKLTLTSIFK